MSDDDLIVLSGANDNDHDNLIQTFQLDSSNLRGRVVRLGSVLEEILAAHNYPQAVAQLLSEATGLSMLLGGMLKFDGIFTLQAQGDGPVRMLISDVTTAGEVRALARFDADKLAAMGLDDKGIANIVGLHAPARLHDLEKMLGTGYLAFTVDQGEHMERYQGIVELKGPDLASCVQHYFEQSEQIDTYIRVAAGQVDGRWRTGGIMIQRLPIPDAEQTPEGLAKSEEDWDRALALIHTCTDDELLMPQLVAGDLLYRLFHEEGVRVYNPQQLRKGCRCDDTKLRGILSTLSADDIVHITVDGKITMTCEFCNKTYTFDPKDLTPPTQGGNA